MNKIIVYLLTVFVFLQNYANLSNLENNLFNLNNRWEIISKKPVTITKSNLLGPLVLNKKMKDFFSIDELTKLDLKTDESVLVSSNTKNNLYQIRVLQQGPLDCTIHAFRNLFFMLYALESPLTLFKDVYKHLLNRNSYDFFNKSVCTEKVPVVSYKNTINVLNLLKEVKSGKATCPVYVSECLPPNAKEIAANIVELSLFDWHLDGENLATNTGLCEDFDNIIAGAEWKDIGDIKDLAWLTCSISLGFKDQYQDFLNHVRNLHKNNSYTFGAFTPVMFKKIISHQTAIICNKSNGTIEYIFLDSENKPYTEELSYKQTINNFIDLTSNLEELENMIIRVICVKALKWAKEDNNKSIITAAIEELKELKLSDHDLFKSYYEHEFSMLLSSLR